MRFSKTQKLLGVLGVMLLLQFLRVPAVVTGGRVWGEEGIFLESASYRSVWDAMTWLAPVGYYVVVLNGVGIIGSRLPLEWMAGITSVTSAFIFLLPVVLASADARWQRLIVGVAAIMLFTGPSEEIWLNVASAQFVLAVAASMMLVTDIPSSNALRIGRGLLLVVVGLSGIASVLLAPLFLVRAIIEKSKRRTLEATILIVCGLLQFVLLLTASEGSARQPAPDIQTTASIVMSRQLMQLLIYPLEVVLPIDSSQIAYQLFTARGSKVGFVLCATGSIGVYLALGWWYHRKRAINAGWLLGCSAILMFTSIGAALESPDLLVQPFASKRYFYAPNVLLLLSILACTFQSNVSFKSAQVRLVVAWLALVGLLHFLTPSAAYFEPADWYARVRAWRQDPSKPIPHAPRGWQVIIPLDNKLER